MESGLRTATVVAETDVTCLSLTRRYESDADALSLLVTYPPSEAKYCFFKSSQGRAALFFSVLQPPFSPNPSLNPDYPTPQYRHFDLYLKPIKAAILESAAAKELQVIGIKSLGKKTQRLHEMLQCK